MHNSFYEVAFWLLSALNLIWFYLHLRAAKIIDGLEQDFADFHIDATQYMAGIRAMREPVEQVPGMP